MQTGRVYSILSVVLAVAVCALSRADDAPAAADDAWEMEYKSKLKLQVSFDFADTALPEIGEFLANSMKINVLVDPNAGMTAGSLPAITLKVSNTPLADAFHQLLEQAGMDYALRDEAVIIFKKGTYTRNMNPEVVPLNESETKKFEKAIADFNSDDFQTREKASDSITSLGPAAAPLLKKIEAKTTDAETLSRVQKLLAGFKGMVIYPESPDVAKALNGLKEKIAFEFEDTPVPQALEYLNTIAKLKMPIPPQSPEGSHVTMKAQSMSAGNALRWLARFSGEKIVLRDGHLELAKP